MISDHKEMAGKFNEYFANVGKNIADKINAKEIDYEKIPFVQETFSFQKIHAFEVKRVIMNLKNKTAPGMDGIMTKNYI